MIVGKGFQLVRQDNPLIFYVYLLLLLENDQPTPPLAEIFAKSVQKYQKVNIEQQQELLRHRQWNLTKQQIF